MLCCGRERSERERACLHQMSVASHSHSFDCSFTMRTSRLRRLLLACVGRAPVKFFPDRTLPLFLHLRLLRLSLAGRRRSG